MYQFSTFFESKPPVTAKFLSVGQFSGVWFITLMTARSCEHTELFFIASVPAVVFRTQILRIFQTEETHTQTHLLRARSYSLANVLSIARLSSDSGQNFRGCEAEERRGALD